MAGPVGWSSPDNHTCDFMSHPFEKPVGRKQTSTAHEGIPEGGLTRDRFRAGIGRLESDTGVRGPGRNQAPASQREMSLRLGRILANDSDRLRRGDVVAYRLSRRKLAKHEMAQRSNPALSKAVPGRSLLRLPN